MGEKIPRDESHPGLGEDLDVVGASGKGDGELEFQSRLEGSGRPREGQPSAHQEDATIQLLLHLQGGWEGGREGGEGGREGRFQSWSQGIQFHVGRGTAQPQGATKGSISCSTRPTKIPGCFGTKSMVTLRPLSVRRLESPLYPLTGTVDAEVDGLVEAQDLAWGHTSQPLSCLGEGRGIGLGVGRGGAFAGGPLRLRVLDLCPVGLVKHVFRVWGRSLLA